MKPSVGDLEDTRKVYEKIFKKDELTDDMPFDFDYDGPEVDDSCWFTNGRHRSPYWYTNGKKSVAMTMHHVPDDKQIYRHYR